MNSPAEVSASFPVGEVNEGMSWKLVRSYRIRAQWAPAVLCRHALPDTSGSELQWRWPLVIEAFNEGGYNSTALCVQCVLDGLEREGEYEPK